MSDEPPLINPGAIPVPLTAPEELESTATTLISDGEEVAQAGQDIKSSWQGLSGVYSAPESDQLVAALNPVATTGDDFSDAMDTVGEALQTFAEKAAKIKKKLVGLRLEAQDFIDNVASKDDWRDDPDNIAKHNDLISEVGSQQAAYQEAERECANKITSIFGGTTFVPADRQVCKPGEVGYGMGFWDLDQATPTPWGSPQTVDEPWYVDAWDGAVDIAAGFGQFAGGATGIYGPDGWAKDPWDSFEIGGHFRHQLVQGAASLFGVRVGDETDLSVSWASDEETWNARKEVAHSIVPWREWGDRPAYVLVQAGINIGSMAFGGAGAVKAMAQGAKGAAGAARAAGAAEAAAAGAADDLAGAASAAGPMPKAGGLPTIGEVAKTPSLWGPAAKGALKAALKDSLGLGNHMPEVPDVGRNLEGGHAPQAGPAPEPHGGHSPQGQAPGAAAGDSGHPAPASSAPDRSATPERATGRSAPTHDTPTPAREGPAAKEPTTSQVQQEIARLEEHVKKHNGDIDAGVDEYIRERQPELVGAGTRSGDHTPTMSAGDRGGPNPRGGSGDAPADTSWEGNRWGTGDTGRPGSSGTGSGGSGHFDSPPGGEGRGHWPSGHDTHHPDSGAASDASHERPTEVDTPTRSGQGLDDDNGHGVPERGEDGPLNGEDAGDRVGSKSSEPYESPQPGSGGYDARLRELSQDPAGGTPRNSHEQAKVEREAEVGLAAERNEQVAKPIRRAPVDNSDPAFQKDGGDFIDANGQKWDVKGPRDTFPPTAGPRAGQPFPPGFKGGFSIDKLKKQIEKELNRGENILLDLGGLSNVDNISAVRDLIQSNPQWDGKVVIVDA